VKEFETSTIREEVAIIGMAGHFPGAKDISQFWHNLCEGIESIETFTPEQLSASGVDRATLENPAWVNKGAVMEGADCFDATFFGFSPLEAEIMDPQHRVFLECAWEGLEDAGYDPETYHGRIGVFGGVALNTYFPNILLKRPDVVERAGHQLMVLANEKDYAVSRVSFKLNLKGPSINVNTACSSSGVALHMACQSILSGECDMALVGGAKIQAPLKAGYLYQEGGILSPDGHCRAFDAEARGTRFGSGVAMIVVKRLSEALQDGDTIHAVVKGTAVNNDGALKVGFTAPSVQGQAAVIEEALAMAEVSPDSIGYVEAHGTGTSLGDPIEVAALTKAYRKWTERTSYCPIGSVKTNIGHLDAAAGIAGIMKTVLALKHKQIPPSLNFTNPNPQIDFEHSPFYVNTKLSDWHTDGCPRRAGVSSFGLGGTNGHIILEEAPEVELSGSSRPQQLLLISAKTGTALNTITSNLVAHMKEHPQVNLADVVYTLQVGRKAFGWRRMVVCQNRDHCVTALENLDPEHVLTSFQESANRNVVFMFSGQGSQYVSMGLELYRSESTFRAAVDRCAEILQPSLSLDLRDILYPEGGNLDEIGQRLEQTSIAQPALFTIEYALAKQWMSWGINPSAMVGHSIGEYVAACLAGVFSLEDVLSLVATRGRLMQELPTGSMLTVPLTEAEILPYLGKHLSLAVVNAPALCVVSGEKEAVEELEKQLAEKNVNCRYLHTSHAFHSKMMDPILQPFTERVKQVRRHHPQIPFLSNVSGTWITPNEALDPSYWTKHLRQSVRFSECVQELLKESNRAFLEIGPGQTLCTLVRQHLKSSKEQIVLSSTRQPKEQKSDIAFILNTLGRLWLAGIQVDWSGIYRDEKRHRIPLPSYPFERKRYWIDPVEAPRSILAPRVELSNKGEDILQVSDRPDTEHGVQTPQAPEPGDYVAPRNETEKLLAEIWHNVLGVKDISIYDNYFDLGGNSLNAARLFAGIDKAFDQKIPLGTLLENSTIERLARILASKDSSSSPSSLVKIQSGNSKPAFFCVHSSGGQVLEYRRLAYHLGKEQPFYALQTAQLNEDNMESLRVENLAASYLKDVQTVQAEGPYYLGGYCLGGMVAFEMAQQLIRKDEEVALLAMISSSTPSHLKNTLPNITAAHHQLCRLLERLELEFSNLITLGMKEKTTYVWERVRRALSLLMIRTEGLVDPLVSNLRMNNDWHSFAYNLQTLVDNMDKSYMQYVPKFYPGSLTLFGVSNQPRRLVSDPYLGWKDFVKSIDIYEVNGYHKNILREPNVKGLAEKLNNRLKEVQQI